MDNRAGRVERLSLTGEGSSTAASPRCTSEHIGDGHRGNPTENRPVMS